MLRFVPLCKWLGLHNFLARQPRASSRRKSVQLQVEVLEDRLVPSANPLLVTDKLDYYLGETVQLYGSGFQAGETVQLQVLHIDGTPNTDPDHLPWLVTDGGAGDLDPTEGSIHTTWDVTSLDNVGSTLEATALGLSSNLLATTVFTDAPPDPPPTVSSINRADPNPSSAASVSWTVTFSENVTGVDSTDFQLANGGLGGTLTISPVSGSLATYTVTATTGTGSGTLGLNLVDNDSIINSASNKLKGTGTTGPNDGSFTGQVYTIDRTAPTVSSIVLANPSPTNAASVNWTVTFSENVTGVDSTDFQLANGGLGGTLTISPVSGSLATYTVTASTGTGSGTLGLNLADNDSIKDAALDVLAGASDGSFTGQVYTIDRTAPTVTSIVRAAADPTNAGSVSWTVTFSESVSGVNSALPNSDFALAVTGLGGSPAFTPISGSGTTYTVTATTGTGDGTLGLNLVDNNSITDAAGNPLGGAGAGDGNFTGEVYTIDKTKPTVTINQAIAPQTDPTNSSPIHFTVVFSESVADFATGDVSLSGTAGATTAVVTGSGTTYDVAVSGMTSDGTVIASIALNVAHDAAGNGNTVGSFTDRTVTYDTTPPTVTINQAPAQVDPTNSSPINFKVVFSEATTDFATGDVALSGTAGATTAVVTGSGTTYNVAVSGMTSDGTVIASLVANVAHDAAGNGNTASASADHTVTYDTTPPDVTINQAPAQVDPTNSSPINFKVVFSEPTTDFATGDVSFTGSTAGGTLVGTVTGSGTTYNVAVSGMTSDGTVIASIALNKAHDAAGNGNTASSSLDNSVTYDTTPPTVTIDQAVGQADPTNVAGIHFTVQFSEPVNDFDDLADVTLTGTATASVTSITPLGGNAYDVLVTASTDGTVIADVGTGVAQDPAGNDNDASTSPTDHTVTYDGTAPTVTIDQAVGQADPTNVAGIHFTVQFSEPVNDFDDLADVTLTGTATASVTSITPLGGNAYDVLVTASTDGTVIADVGTGVAQDPAGNDNDASTSPTDHTVTYDGTAPTVTIDQAVGQADPTNVAGIHFTVQFSEPVNDFDDLADVTLTGTATASVTSITPLGGNAYDVLVTASTDGTVIADVGTGVAQDPAGNDNDASTSPTDHTVTYDTTPPTVTIDQAVGQADPTNVAGIHFTVQFSEPVNDFDDLADVTLTGTATASVTSITPLGGNAYDVLVTASTDGTVIADVGTGVAQDPAGNDNDASTSPTDHTVTYDATAPTVTIDQAVGQADPTNVAGIHFTVQFSEPVNDFDDLADVTLTGTATASVTSITPLGGNAYDVLVTASTDGTVIADVGTGVAQDPAGNDNDASTSPTDHTVTYDGTAPTVTIDQAVGQADPTNVAGIHFTVQFSEPVNDFDDLTDVTLTGTATASVTSITPLGGNAYDVLVTASTDGTVIADVGTGVAQDPAGNDNDASTSPTDHTVTYDTTPPTVTIDIVDSSLSDSDNSSVVNFTFSEAPVGFVIGDISATSGTMSTLVMDTATTYHATFTANDNYEGLGSVTINAAKFTDAAGNDNVAATPDTVTIDTKNPTVTIDIVDSSLSDSDNSSVVNFTFSEAPGASFVIGDISATNGATSSLVMDTATTYHATFTANDGFEGQGSVTINAAKFTDAAGNANVAATPDTVTIDTKNPTVTSVTPNLTLITDANVGSNTFKLTVVFSEAMNTAFTPSITFPTAGENPLGTSLTFSSGAWSAGNTTYTATYNVVDLNVVMPNIDVRVSGGKDVASNLQVTGNFADKFSISTVTTVGSVSLVPDPLHPGYNMLVVNGTDLADKILISPPPQKGALTVSISNSLSSVSYAFTPAQVGTISRIVVHGNGGDDNIQVTSAISKEAWLYGDNGNDRINGGGGNNIELGGEGNDTLIGGSARNILIGGNGADTIGGNGGDDILIAGFTDYDGNDPALAAILKEWTRTDTNGTYDKRRGHLQGTLSGGCNLGFLLTSATVHGDGLVNRMTGASGNDWFFGYFPRDIVTDLGKTEQKVHTPD